MDELQEIIEEVVEEKVNEKEYILQSFAEMLLYSTDYKNTDAFEYRASLIREASLKYEIDENEFWDRFNEELRQYVKGKVTEYSKSNCDTYKRITSRSILESQLKIFIPGNSAIKQILDYFERETAKPLTLTTKEFFDLAKTKDDKDYIVESLLHRRMFLTLVAYAKVGKTLFAYNLLVSVVTGKDWLNRKTNPTKVLFIQNEEGLKEASSKVYNNRIGQYELEDPELFNKLVEENRILVMKDVDIVEDAQYIFNYIQEHNVGLLIIDSLSASLKKCGLTELSPELPSQLYKFQSLVHKYEICCILLHHTTKVESSESQTDRLKSGAGRSGVARPTDGQIMLQPVVEKKQINTNKLNVYFDLRHGAPSTMELERVEEEANQWHWVITKEELLSEENISIQNDILCLLRDRYFIWVEQNQGMDAEDQEPIYGLSLTEIMAEVNLPREVVVKRLNWMITAKGIEHYKSFQSKKYIYHYPASGESWLYKYVEDAANKVEVQKLLEEADNKIRMELVSCTTYDQVASIVKDYSKEDKQRIFSKLSKDDKLKINLLKFPPLYPVGSFVLYEDKELQVESVTFSTTPQDVSLNDRRIYYLVGEEVPVEEKQLKASDKVIETENKGDF